MIVVGIDLGVTGALTAIGPQGLTVHDLMLLPIERVRRFLRIGADEALAIGLVNRVLPEAEL